MRPFSILLLPGLLLGSSPEVMASVFPGPEIQAVQAAASPSAPPAPEELLTDKAEAPPAATFPSRKDKRPGWLPDISGYIQLGCEGSNSTSSFFIKRACLYLTGSPAPKLDYYFQFDFALPAIIDACIAYRPFSQLGIKAGQYKVPFSIENTIYAPVRFEFIEYPLALTRLMGLNDLCGLRSTGRDLGVSLYGGFIRRGDRNLIDYEIGVFNGEGINTRDRNRSKDLSAQLAIQPLPGLRVSASGYRGEYGPDHRRRVRYGAGICYDRNAVVLRSEWIGGETGIPAGEGSAPGRILESRGWYAMGGWRITPAWMPVVRYDTFLEEASNHQSRQCNCTAGTVWQPIRHLRCQVNYTFEYYAARGVANRNVLSVMLSGIF